MRSDLFSADQMEQHGKVLAGAHQLGTGRTRDRLLGRLAENETLLLDVHKLLTLDVKGERRITPAGEWLLDNFYVIEEQIRTAGRHLPKGYSRELPRLALGASAGLPRVYDLALETIAHGDGRVDPETLRRFVSAYQSVSALTLGELWAIPIMLRLTLIENLRRVAARIAGHRLDRNRAEAWADKMTAVAAGEPQNLILAIADMARSDPPMVSSFVAELTRRLHGQGPALALPLTWIEQRLSESGLTSEELVRSENQQQAADQVSISNSIGSLRALGAMDWRGFVEAMSLVEQTLSEDPSGIYACMDFATRDRYRHAVERTAKASPLSEAEVARMAVGLAREALVREGQGDRAAHVGFFLIDDGLEVLAQTARARSGLAGSLRIFGRGHPLFLYCGAILFMTVLFAASLAGKAAGDGLDGWRLAVLGGLCLFCASHLAVALANWLATLLVAPQALPRMDFSKGIPREFRTLVVVPTMLTSARSIEELVKALEVRFLANRDEFLHFGLLTDFGDAATETLPEDEPLLRLARERIEGLNGKYLGSGGENFFLFHRPRQLNPQDAVWMGRERKRGKLSDLNRLLRGGGDEAFALVVGHVTVLQEVRYVITLDTDTQLPRDTARQFVGAMAHPLNRPRLDERKGRVTGGYGILQPRIAASLSGTNRSRYARMCASEIGIDPYTRAVSDVYQDLFGEGSFIGKGIYDVDAFERTLGGRFPDNRILSHDLLEGCHARCGLLSDVQLYEEYPARYSADANRRHRWIRGDWQIARWLLPGVPGPDGRPRPNPLSLLSRWKIADNLRRSLTAAALTLLLLAGWTVLASAWFWTLSVCGVILLPAIVSAGLTALQKPEDRALRQHLAATARLLPRHFAQAAFSLVCLPYEAFFSLDALARTAWRMLVTRRGLLEWNPSAEAGAQDRTDLVGSCRTMWFAPFLAVATGVGLASFRPMALLAAAPILGLWLVSPAVAWWLSLPLARHRERLTGAQTLFLRKIARKTWAYFETFVGPEDHWLPPDNYQEHPVAVVAHRTSPTNMGLALLSNLTAYDFGIITCGRMLERSARTLETMAALERHRGHFFNWYDTLSLAPLPPQYISAVDSGNLAGHLLTLRSGLLALAGEPILSARLFESLADTLELALDAASEMPAAELGADVPALLAGLRHDLAPAAATHPGASATCGGTRLRLAQLASAIETLGAALAVLGAAPDNELNWWVRALADQCRDALAELDLFAPWSAPEAWPEALADIPVLQVLPTLRGLAELEPQVLAALARGLAPGAPFEAGSALAALAAQAQVQAQARIASLEALAAQCGQLASMDYDFLYDEKRRLLAIGYNVDERRRDLSCYDLLASEARLATFVAIAQGQLPQESWFALGRLLTTAGGEPILLSWSGSMFEYLMPMLVMPSYEHTLLDQTCAAAVARQMDYGRKRGVPWGISECGYNAIDMNRNYQYRAFGVPGLGLKRGLAEDLVIAPYATVMALMVAPQEACRNLLRLAEDGYETRFGFYEAIDFTPSRLPRGQASAVVRSFMVHHQGMSFLSLASQLLGRPMQRRFKADAQLQATLPLLQERIPQTDASFAHTTELSEGQLTSSLPETPMRVYDTPQTPSPEVQLLSNGRYHVMVTNAGGGYSRWKDLAVTRWREDATCDNWGSFCYLRDVATREFWSTALQPTQKPPKHYEAIFSEDRVEFHRRDNDYDTRLEIAVSPEDDIELRRLRITNRARTRRAIDVTSYAEVALAQQAADALHPAFSNLFVQTEVLAPQRAILCTRRPRSQGEAAPYLLHLMAVRGGKDTEV
ncbi:MAG TPA: glucoamylase family protein, partial [Humidesulfovibrio sp.]|uniref:glucoamylase family protein n=1 Tax=Humidesulfovibrio sp. TaxID=2910988 RepID=UPI002C8D98E2